MKVIDLLNKIANGEEVPKKIKFENDIYIHIDNYCYYCEETNLILSDRIFAEHYRLNDEVEIIEEDKEIEKLELMFPCDKFDSTLGGLVDIYNSNFENVKRKINELIKSLNELKKGK